MPEQFKRLFTWSKRKPCHGGGELVYFLSVSADGAAKKLPELPNEAEAVQFCNDLFASLHDVTNTKIAERTQVERAKEKML